MKKSSTLGSRIRAARIRRELTQQEAAAALGVHEVTWNRWESGLLQPTLAHLLAVAKALRIEPQRLILG